jgi:hypothetical protein
MEDNAEKGSGQGWSLVASIIEESGGKMGFALLGPLKVGWTFVLSGVK